MTAATLIEHPAVERQRLHRKLSRLIDRLILILDDLDDDPDLEPSLSASIPTPWTRQTDWTEGTDDDREDQCEGEGEQCEDEGAEHDGREPEPHD